jgi:threonine synthase
VEALGEAPERPAGFEDLEKRPQRVEVIMPDARAVKRLIEASDPG